MPPPTLLHYPRLAACTLVVSCSANSRLKTRRESAPCGVTSPRRACRSAEEGPLRGSDRGDTRQAGGRHAIGRLHGRFPASGAAVEAEQGPQLQLGMRPEIRRTRDRAAALDCLRGQIPEQKTFGAPLPLSGDPCSTLHRPPPLSRTRALPDADFAGFPIDDGLLSNRSLDWLPRIASYPTNQRNRTLRERRGWRFGSVASITSF
jgi:hypothetical protein